MSHLRILLSSIFLSLLVLSACNLTPSAGDQQYTDPRPLLTAAAQTVEAQLTLNASPLPTLSPIDTQAFTSTPSTTGTPTTAVTSAPAACDVIGYDPETIDVTIPDGTQLLPGQTFTKTWRLKNVGSCVWTSGYALVFDAGDAIGGPPLNLLQGITVAPGGSVEISVQLTAPEAPGTYRGYWKLRNASGVVFGLGSDNKPFFVEITVAAATPSPTP